MFVIKSCRPVCVTGSDADGGRKPDEDHHQDVCGSPPSQRPAGTLPVRPLHGPAGLQVRTSPEPHRRPQVRTDSFTVIHQLYISLYTNCVCVCRYVLISRPSEWSDQLRIKFLEGFEAFLELLKCMQVTHTWRHTPDTYLDPQPVCLLL